MEKWLLLCFWPLVASSAQEWITANSDAGDRHLHISQPVAIAALHSTPGPPVRSADDVTVVPGRNTFNKVLIDDILTNITTYGKPTVGAFRTWHLSITRRARYPQSYTLCRCDRSSTPTTSSSCT